nr:MAG TPA: hypothetical protein [Caudoviricetes sp.]
MSCAGIAPAIICVKIYILFLLATITISHRFYFIK